MSVVDASLLIDAYAGDTPHGEQCRSALEAAAGLHAPALLPAEFMAGIRGLTIGGHLSEDRALRALGHFAETRLHLYGFSQLADRVWELRHNATTYDAWYLALAEALDQPVLTVDAKLLDVPGVECVVSVV